jgi:hypothetical protein
MDVDHIPSAQLPYVAYRQRTAERDIDHHLTTFHLPALVGADAKGPDSTI